MLQDRHCSFSNGGKDCDIDYCVAGVVDSGLMLCEIEAKKSDLQTPVEGMDQTLLNEHILLYNVPVKESACHNPSPGQARRFLTFQVFGDFSLGAEYGHGFDDSRIWCIAAKFARNESLDASLDSCIHEFGMKRDICQRSKVHNHVLVFECRNYILKGIRVFYGLYLYV